MTPTHIMMQIQIQLPASQSKGNPIVMVARGVLNIAGFHQIFVEINRLTELHSEGEVLIDLAEALYELQAAEIDDFIDQSSWSHAHKIALVAARRSEHFNQVSALSACLLKHGFKTAVFYDATVAADWLQHSDSFLL